jgi:hypothetical protein
VDDTLLDNDQVERELSVHLIQELGPAVCDRYFQLFEELRTELGYADYLGTLQRYRMEAMHDPRILRLSCWLVDYPFADRLYPSALDVIEKVSGWGAAAVLSDGDAVFQPRKIQRSGIWDAVSGNVLIYLHKEHELGDVERLLPARHYVMLDDKLHILTSMKESWGDRLTTVFVRQGHYAADAKKTAAYPPADVSVDAIGELLEIDATALVPPS